MDRPPQQHPAAPDRSDTLPPADRPAGVVPFSGDGQATGEPVFSASGAPGPRPVRSDRERFFDGADPELIAAFEHEADGALRGLSATDQSDATRLFVRDYTRYLQGQVEGPPPSLYDCVDAVTMDPDSDPLAEPDPVLPEIPAEVRASVREADRQRRREARAADAGVVTMAAGLDWYTDASEAEARVVLDFDRFWGTGIGGEPVPFTLERGEVLMLVGDTGVGKSSLVANVLFHAMNGTGGHPPVRALDASLEMPKRDLIGRALQIGHGLRVGADTLGRTYDEVVDAARRWPRERLLAPVAKLSLFSVADAPLAFSKLEAAIRATEADLVVVDTPESLLPPAPPPGMRSYSETRATEKVWEDLMGLADRCQVGMIVVQHISKAGQRNVADGGVPALSDVKGLTKAVQAVSFVVGFGGPRHASRRTLRLLKRRRTQTLNPASRDDLGELVFEGEPLTLRFRPYQATQAPPAALSTTTPPPPSPPLPEDPPF